MDRDQVLEALTKAKVFQKNAECVVELLMLYRRLPHGEERNIVCASMNELANIVTDLQHYLETGERSAVLAKRVRDQRTASLGA